MISELKALILHIESGNVCVPALNFPAQLWWLTPFLGCSVSTSALLELSLVCWEARVAGREVKACRSVPLRGDRSWGREQSGTPLWADSQLWSLMCLPLLAVPLYVPDRNLGVCLALQSLLSTSQPAVLSTQSIRDTRFPWEKLIPDRSAHTHSCLCHEL